MDISTSGRHLRRLLLGGARSWLTEDEDRTKCRDATIAPNSTGYALGIQTALGLHISELPALRRGYINVEQSYRSVTGIKAQRSFRIVPLKEQLVPWLNELKGREAGSADSCWFLIRTHPHRGSLTPVAHNSPISRYARALKHSALTRRRRRHT